MSTTPVKGTININSGTITYTLLGNGYNTVYLVFSFDTNQVGAYELQPPTLNLVANPGDTSGSFNINFTLQAPSGQVLGNLMANNLTVTPATQPPANISNTSLIS